ncbi:hypothetical protein CTI12_AA070950 [Artemisia annua]|uniref:Uncharacterized protein n=1 Tax=Artemisia annua TaxID=35608 RepID=A0A2U1Q4J7_ARTAN|nr:hypothetical protein CTI12_AA070950 [Artemisia annua]
MAPLNSATPIPPITCESRDFDIPPESFWLSKDAELDWFDRNAFLERNESIKPNSNPITLIQNKNNTSTSVHVSAFLKSKPVDTKTKTRNCKIANILLFPKRSDSIGNEPEKVLNEPWSPKVSCLGKVRSKRCRRKVTRPGGSERTGRTGFMWRMTSFFRCGCYGGRKTHGSPES